MTEERTKQLLLNVLSEISKTTEMDKETFVSWLKLEVGFTKDEIQDLEDAGLYYPEEYTNEI